ncbi:hypothetical protein BHE74_00057688 [Ensete ventricosum]|nr:hypothetical protein BHE74_00057688 [Ensete ventricosum]
MKNLPAPDGSHVVDNGSHSKAALGDDPAAEMKDAYQHGAGHDCFSGDSPCRWLRRSLTASFRSMSTNRPRVILFRHVLSGPLLRSSVSPNASSWSLRAAASVASSLPAMATIAITMIVAAMPLRWYLLAAIDIIGRQRMKTNVYVHSPTTMTVGVVGRAQPCLGEDVAPKR